MTVRLAIGYATLVVAALPTSWLVFRRDHPDPVSAMAAVGAPHVPARADAMPSADSGLAEDATTVPVDALTRYLAMRDDINPKPRLALIDAWAREVRSGNSIDLLTQALVDADESVRARAEVLFERRWAHR